MPESQQQLVTVFSTYNPALIAVVKSLLDDAGINYIAKGDNFLGTTYVGVPIGRGVEFQVWEEDAEQARELLKDIV